MGYTKDTLDTLRLLRDIDWEEKTIIEFGSQDIDTDIDSLHDFIRSFNKKPLDLKDYISENYSRLSTRYLYESICIKKYDCIDIDGTHNSLKFDLNYNLQDKYNFTKKYDIVTNFGTTEHIFNQYSCFENIHNLCNEEGLMIISLPIEGYSNHCFFNYHPTFFEHLANNNNYEILYMDYNITAYHKDNDSKNITVIFKKSNNENFIIPVQTEINKPVNSINKFNNEKLVKHFYALTDIDLNSINNLAIFGTAQAGEDAYLFSQKANKEVLCFIDDFKSGNYKDSSIPIVSYDEFIHSYQKKVDLIIQGNKQNGNLKNRTGLDVNLVELSSLINFK
ncbi:hypothetical protein [Sulfurimonas sp.]|uniref:hypothetical protein n=1 Tax=Sulfurimonas sp. TaxID=2022749 RepID=UPI0035674C7D